MKEIKYRAWNKSKMLYDVQLSEEFCFMVTRQGEYVDVKLMQYTGYNDSNGREVYEGDIYAMEKYRHGEKIVTYWTVVWNELEYGFSLVANIVGEKYREDVYLPLRAIDGNRMEYAGNIHDNSELIS